MEEILTVNRVGSLLIDNCNVKVPSIVEDYAKDVRKEANNLWQAGTAAAACSWLLEIAHYNSVLAEAPTASLSTGREAGFRAGFRGQSARYESLLPTICRDGVDIKLQERAQSWFRVLLQTWCNTSFVYCAGPSHKFWFDRDGASAAAQHYGVGTNFIDWTWDPLIAFAFAADQEVGEMACVLIAGFEAAKSNIVIPPPAVVRPWRQRGFFQYQPCAEALASPMLKAIGVAKVAELRQSVSNYYRVTFRVDAEVRRLGKTILQYLYADEERLQKLKTASLALARLSEPSRSLLAGDPSEVEAWLARNRQNLVDYSAFRAESPSKEDINLQLSYLDSCALEYDPQNEVLGYSTASLSGFVQSVGTYSVFNSRREAGGDLRLAYSANRAHFGSIDADARGKPFLAFSGADTSRLLADPTKYCQAILPA